MRQRSKKKIAYDEWLKAVVRPFVIERDGNNCVCCGRAAYVDEKLDLDHIKGKGSHPELKRDLDNFQLLCRFPCHRNKTDRVECTH